MKEIEKSSARRAEEGRGKHAKIENRIKQSEREV